MLKGLSPTLFIHSFIHSFTSQLHVGNLATHCSFRLAEEVGFIVYFFQLSGSKTEQKAWLRSWTEPPHNTILCTDIIACLNHV